MPSEDLAEDLSPRAIEAMSPRLEAFRSGVATAAERLRAEPAELRGAGDDRAAQAAEELGLFAAGRIDPERFAALFGGGDTTDAGALDELEAAGLDYRLNPFGRRLDPEETVEFLA